MSCHLDETASTSTLNRGETSIDMFETLVILSILIVAIAIIKLCQINRKLKQLASQIDTKAYEPNDLVLALGQIPEGNYQSFITDPEGFARAHASAERISMIEQHKAKEVKECLDAARRARKEEREYAIDFGMNHSATKQSRAVANALEQRAQRLIDDENVFRSSAQLRATDDSA